jgi:hypothetical protein
MWFVIFMLYHTDTLAVMLKDGISLNHYIHWYKA